MPHGARARAAASARMMGCHHVSWAGWQTNLSTSLTTASASGLVPASGEPAVVFDQAVVIGVPISRSAVSAAQLENLVGESS